MAKAARTLSVLTAFALLVGCARPTHNPSALKEIRAESETLMRGAAPRTSTVVPKAGWPTEITSLRPYSVTVLPDGLEITMKPYFDGGWGYFVPRPGGNLPQPVGRFSGLGEGVYWFHPY